MITECYTVFYINEIKTAVNFPGNVRSSIIIVFSSPTIFISTMLLRTLDNKIFGKNPYEENCITLATDFDCRLHKKMGPSVDSFQARLSSLLILKSLKDLFCRERSVEMIWDWSARDSTFRYDATALLRISAQLGLMSGQIHIGVEARCNMTIHYGWFMQESCEETHRVELYRCATSVGMPLAFAAWAPAKSALKDS